MEKITKEGINAQKLLSDLLQRRTSRTTSFKLPYEDRDAASYALFLAVQAEVESRCGADTYNVDEALNRRVCEIGEWLIDNKSTGLFLCGNTGSGKTTIMDAIINLYSLHDITHNGVNVGFNRIEATELYQMYKYHYNEFEDLKKSPMLAIDDLGIEPVYVNVFGTDISPISELIYHRYQRQLLTIITTNLRSEEVRKRYGDRIADRFKEMMKVVVFANPSYRGNIKSINNNNQNQQL